MRRIVLGILLLCSSCDTQVVELFPGDAATVFDAEETTRDAAAEDLGFAPDAEAPDLGFAPDSSFAPDAENPDAASACVCRFLCRSDPECVRAIGPGSTCELGLCTGATNSCTSVSQCGTGFICTENTASTNRCN